MKETQKRKKHTDKYGILLYCLIMVGFAIYMISSIGVANLRGNEQGGWVVTYFDGKGQKVVEQIVNYVINFMSGFSSLLAGYFLVKYGHKYAVLISFSCISLAILIPWLHHDVDGADPLGFALFVIMRAIMAFGGSIIVIYIQPVIAKYIKNKKTQARLSSFAPITNIGAMLSWVLFSMSPEISQFFWNNWQIVASLIGVPGLILLIVYALVAENFKQEELPAKEVKALPKGQIATFKDVLSDKRVVMLALIYSIWSVLALLPTLLFPSMLNGLHSSYSAGELNHHGYLGYFHWGAMWVIVFSCSMFVSPFIVTKLKLNDNNRTKILMLMFGLAILAYVGSILLGMVGNAAIWGSLVFAFLAGLILWIIQSVIWTIPFAFDNQSPQRIGLIFATFRLIGFNILTLFNIIFALLLDPTVIGETTIQGFNEPMNLGALIFAIIFITLAIASIPILKAMPKTNAKPKKQQAKS